MYPEVDFQESTSLAQSESVNPVILVVVRLASALVPVLATALAIARFS
jgi:hypothetical protein